MTIHTNRARTVRWHEGVDDVFFLCFSFWFSDNRWCCSLKRGLWDSFLCSSYHWGLGMSCAHFFFDWIKAFLIFHHATIKLWKMSKRAKKVLVAWLKIGSNFCCHFLHYLNKWTFRCTYLKSYHFFYYCVIIHFLSSWNFYLF